MNLCARLARILPAAACLLAALLVTAGTALAAPQQGGTSAGGAERQDEPLADATTADRLYRVGARLTERAPQIDGSLDDPEWRLAPVLTDFIQSTPAEGAPVSERTEVRVLYDSEALYISARMYDSRPDQVVATVLRRDESHDDNDAFAVTLDTYHDHRNGFFFETNALGARFDAQIIGEGGSGGGGGGGGRGQSFNRDWDAVWEAAGRITDEGWEVEIAIPFWSLRFDRQTMSTWGINFRRAIPRKSEEAYWAPVPRQFNATRLSLSGVLTGLDEVGRPRTLQLKPFALGDISQLPDGPTAAPFADHATTASGDIGLDVKWSVTPNLTLDGTVNTDFAQVEADDVQINLTRFPLFFPEKREFFLENAGLFTFGSGGMGSPRVIGFHSRRIGIEDGGEVPILAGARLTGKAGGWNLGVLTMQTDDVDAAGLPTENHSVLRVQRDLGSRSSVGVLVTNQQAGGDDYNRGLGLDGRWAATGNLTIDGWWMSTQTGAVEPGIDDSEWAGAVNGDWSDGTWNVSGSVTEIGEAFNPELGFVSRLGVRSYDSTVMWTPYFPDSPAVRNHSPHVSFGYLTDRHGRLLTRRWHLDWDTYLRRGDKLSVAHNRMFEQLDLPFEIVPGVVIPPGAYSFEEVNLELQSDQSRPVYASLNYTWGDFWDGTRKNLRTSVGFRLGARFSSGVSWDRNDVELGAGAFVTDLWRMRLSYDFNTSLFLSGLFQYDSLTNQFLSNVRVNFIHTPGADVFLVYNERRLTEDPTLIDRALILKVTHLLRF